jgi:pectinesterase
MGRLTDAIALLEDSPALSAEDDRALRDWFRTYFTWLRTSQHGKDEAAEPNNHGTWYDVQMVALSLLLNDTATAREVAEQARSKRIAAQVDSLGHQPLELARTRSLHYSVENLEGMTRLAETARAVGVDLWDWQAASGGGIRRAIAFVAPFATKPEKWQFKQITKEAPGLFLPLLRRAGITVEDTSAFARTHRSRLLYPDAPDSACNLECMLVSQLIVAGRPTGWPEKSVISVPRTLEALRSLMSIDKPSPRVRTAVHAAVAWLTEAALHPGPLWAKSYDVRTGAPLGVERITEPRHVLADYPSWVGKHAPPKVAQAVERYDAVVDARFAGAEGSIVDGVRTYRRIAAALQNAAEGSERPYVIRIRNGRYYEKLSVESANIHFSGESRDRTVLTFDAAAASPAPSGGTYGTRGSSTLRIAAPGFRLENMTVENGFDYMRNYVKPDSDATKLRGTQGVAVMLDYGSDHAAFENCTINGHQDTLFPNAGRSYFHRCAISGSVDFIFGAGSALFDDVDIISRDRGSRSNNGYITAASTPISQPYGFVIVNSRLKKESPALAPNTVTLGRSWHPAGDPDAVGSAVFIDTWMDDHIGAKGWDSMNSINGAGVRTTHRPEEARFYEFGSTGPGVVASPTRRVLEASEVERIRAWSRTMFPNPK